MAESKIVTESPMNNPTEPENPKVKEYSGACHCKKFQFVVEHPVIEDGSAAVTECNCSYCEMKGVLWIYAKEDCFRFVSGSWDELALYQFNKRVIKHYFCALCGTQIVEKWSQLGINVRTLDGIDLKQLTIQYDDGKSLE